MQTLIHYFLHLVLPLLFARLLFKNEWKKAYLIMLATMLVDLDHLVASPIFDPHRCSIGYHPFHSYYVIPLYAAMVFFKKPWRIIGIGLLWHMITDYLDCQFMS